MKMKAKPLLLALALSLAIPLGAFAADNLKIQISRQNVTVDGKKVQITAYNINGHNYFKVKDLGSALGFPVSYDAATDTVVLKSAPAATQPAPQQVSLKDWQGTWNNMLPYLDNMDELKPAYRGLAGAKKTTIDAVKQELQARRKCDFAATVVAGETIKYYDAKQDSATSANGKLLGEDTYRYVGPAEGTKFLKFEATNSKPYAKYLLMMPPSKDEALTHYHFRYGNVSFEDLLAQKHYPTVIAHNSTWEQLREEIYTPALKDWAGTWNSTANYLDSKELDAAYATLAKKENKTVEAIKAEKKALYAADFSSVVFTEHAMNFYNAADGKGQLVATGDYAFKGYVKNAKGHSFFHFEGKPGATYKHVLLIPTHNWGTGLVHFHARYGNDVETLMNASNWPTGIHQDSTMAQLAEEMTE